MMGDANFDPTIECTGIGGARRCVSARWGARGNVFRGSAPSRGGRRPVTRDYRRLSAGFKDGEALVGGTLFLGARPRGLRSHNRANRKAQPPDGRGDCARTSGREPLLFTSRVAALPLVDERISRRSARGRSGRRRWPAPAAPCRSAAESAASPLRSARGQSPRPQSGSAPTQGSSASSRGCPP